MGMVKFLALIHLCTGLSTRTWPSKQKQRQLLSSGVENGDPEIGLSKGKRLSFPLRKLGVDTDFMPRPEASFTDHSTCGKFALQDWGIERQHHPVPAFPDSIDSVAENAFRAIVGTLNGNHCLDPNLAGNAMSRNTVLDYRPVRKAHDSGRIGIEIDGAIHLKSESSDYSGPFYHDSNASALRHLMLVLAGKFSERSWNSKTTKSLPASRPPVAIFFNTMKQTLEASRQLHILQEQTQSHGLAHHRTSLYENVKIHCLGQDDDLPYSHMHPMKRTRRRNHVNPGRGVIIVVQPTDFNDEYPPPGPAVGLLSSFQKLVARASAQEVPVVMVSPRFYVDASFAVGWTQGAGSHQASTYGGSEPPREAAPWILRDFNPPVFCWVGNALPLTAKDRFDQQQHRLRLPSLEERQKPHMAYSLIVLTQSVMDEGHPWHVFAARHPTDTDASVACDGDRSFQYDYLASTKSSPGRPTQAILRRILAGFCT